MSSYQMSDKEWTTESCSILCGILKLHICTILCKEGLLNEESSSRLTFIFNRMITRIRKIQSVTPGVWTLFCVAGVNLSQACSFSRLLLHNKELQAILWHIGCAQCRETWKERAPNYIFFLRYIICLIDHSTLFFHFFCSTLYGSKISVSSEKLA